MCSVIGTKNQAGGGARGVACSLRRARGRGGRNALVANRADPSGGGLGRPVGRRVAADAALSEEIWELRTRWTDGAMGAAAAPGRFGKGVIALVVTAPDGTIRKVCVMQGRSVFAKLKDRVDFEGRSSAELKRRAASGNLGAGVGWRSPRLSNRLKPSARPPAS